MKRRAIQVICLWAVVLSASPMTCGAKYAGGTGEPNDPYLIATAEQLQAADFNVPGTYYRLCNDIDMDGSYFFPPYRFEGHLDGAGLSIRNITNSWVGGGGALAL